MANFASSSVKPLTVLTEDDGVPGSKIEQDPENYTVEQLKRWLKCRGLKQSGKRGEIVQRVSDCLKGPNHRILDVSIDGGKWFAIKVLKENEELSKKENVKEECVVPAVPASGWRSFPSYDIPVLFNYGHIYYYALESIRTVQLDPSLDVRDEDINKENEMECGLGHMTDKPLKNGRKYVDSKFVHDLMDNKTEQHYFLKGHVWPSMRAELPHNVLIILSATSGAIIHASCYPCKVAALGRCSHIVAVLFSLLDHVEKYGPAVSKPATSQECTWNKGKKRDKDPKRLSCTDYPSKKRKAAMAVEDFDPRPAKYRQVKPEHVNGLLRDLQSISANKNESSMWETQLQLSYDDYEQSDIDMNIVNKQIKILIENLTPPQLMQIPGTGEQSKSNIWFSERWRRLTASKCLAACRIGKLAVSGAPNTAVRAFKFIKSNIWKIDQEPFQSYWMKYGLESEPKAIEKYESQTNREVSTSGFWVNPKYPFLGSSPDGLVGEDGIIEIKSLKIFKHHTIESVSSNKSSVPKVVINKQCFTVNNNKCELRHSHEYYYQIQMQLLVTEKEFCDFILYAENGPVSIERIYRDEHITADILKWLTSFWTRIIAPELFEMRIPRNLYPFIFPESGVNVGTILSKSEEAENVEVPIEACTPAETHSTPFETDAEASSIPDLDVKETSAHTQDELEVAYFLEASVRNTVIEPPVRLSRAIDNLVVFPWGGLTSAGIQLVNTCPVDNWMMLFQALVKLRKVDLDELGESGKIICDALKMIDENQYSDAKVSVLPDKPRVISNIINFYGGEDELFLKHLQSFMKSRATTLCSSENCPQRVDMLTSSNITLGCPRTDTIDHDNILMRALRDWLHPNASRCARKFQHQPPQYAQHFMNATINDDGEIEMTWHCSGQRTYSPRVLFNLKNFLIISVDLLSRCNNNGSNNTPFLLCMDNTPSTISVCGQDFALFGVTLWNGSHYICMFNTGDYWLMYDGLKEYNTKGSGVWYSHTKFKEPPGYYLSHLIYCI